MMGNDKCVRLFLHLVLRGRETWSSLLWREHKLTAREKRVLRWIFEP
jgi:hypothetical protein